MKYRQLYVALDHKHVGVVTCVADSPTEFAQKCGVDLSAVSHSVSAMRQNPHKKRRFASVWTAWSDREYAKYFGEVSTC